MITMLTLEKDTIPNVPDWSDRREDESIDQYIDRLRFEMDKMESKCAALTVENLEMKDKIRDRNKQEYYKKTNLRNSIISRALSNVTSLLEALCIISLAVTLLSLVSCLIELNNTDSVDPIFIIGAVLSSILSAVFFMLGNNRVFEDGMRLYLDMGDSHER